MKEQTISVHNGNSGTVGQKHNNREADYLKNHVNQDHVDVNGYHRTIKHENVEDAINRIFADALEEYNARKRADVKHPGREISNYYKHLEKQRTSKKKEEGIKGKRKNGYNAMETCYEMILQFGNMDTVNRTGDDAVDQDNLSPELAEKMLMETIQRMQNIFMIAASDKEGIPIYEEDGTRKMWKCMELIGVYIHDDEAHKGIHAHIDYVPIAHNYSRGLSMQPGLTKALEEMGFADDNVKDLYAERTSKMKELYGIDYHDTDYLDKKGKPLDKKYLSQEMLVNRELASKLVPKRTAQMKFQDKFREVMKEVMLEHNVPLDQEKKEPHDHMEHKQIQTLGAIKAETKLAQEKIIAMGKEVEGIDEDISEKQQRLEIYDTAISTPISYDDLRMEATNKQKYSLADVRTYLETPVKKLPEPKFLESAAQYKERVADKEHSNLLKARMLCKCMIDVARVLFAKYKVMEKAVEEMKIVRKFYGDDVIEKIKEEQSIKRRLEKGKERTRNYVKSRSKNLENEL